MVIHEAGASIPVILGLFAVVSIDYLGYDPGAGRQRVSCAAAEFSLDNSLLLLDLVVDSDIPEYISIALERGFAVPIMFEVEIRAIKRYWFDPRVVSLKQQYLLHYQPMLDSYVVLDINSFRATLLRRSQDSSEIHRSGLQLPNARHQ